MHTYTHLDIGINLGLTLFPHSPLKQAACAVASVLPDLVMVPKFVMDKCRGRPPLEYQSPMLMALKQCSHSLVLWMLVGIVAMLVQDPLGSIVLAFSIGGVSHVVIDILTHKDQKYRQHEATYLWPLPGSLQGLAVYEYRIGTGILLPKLPELILNIALVGYRIYAYLR